MKLKESLPDGHELIGETLAGGVVRITAVGPEGDKVVIGTYYPPDQVHGSNSILDNKSLTKAVGNLLSKFARRWEE